MKKQRTARADSKFGSLLACAFLLIATLSVYLSPTCSDCSAARGWPLPYYRSGGFVGGGHFIWGGMLGDMLTIFSIGSLLWALLNALSKKHRSQAHTKLLRFRTWGWIRLTYGVALALDVAGTLYRQATGRIETRDLPADAVEQIGYIIAFAALSALSFWLMRSGHKRIAADIAPSTPSPPRNN